MKIAIATLLLAVSAAFAELIPPDRLADWSLANVGVPGGIDQYRPGGAKNRSNIITVSIAPGADAKPAIQAAIDTAPENSVIFVPAGTYRIDSSVIIGYRKNLTLRGAGPDKTLFNYYGPSGQAFKIGGDETYMWDYPDVVFTGTRGATTIQCDQTANIVVGKIIRLAIKNSQDPNVPVLSTNGPPYDYTRKQMALVTAKTANSVTITPGLYFDCPAGLTPKLAQVRQQAEYCGLEDFAVNGTNSNTPHALVAIQQGYGSWIYNVWADVTPNYNVDMGSDVRCELRMSRGTKRKSAGSNGAGLLMGNSTACLIEDNIFGEQFPSIEVNGGSTGNVFAYNFCYGSAVFGGAGSAINTNHNPFNSYNLYEGNISPNVQADGYFGGAGYDMFFRNWFHGINDTEGQIRGICVNFNRGTRMYSVVANILGTDGTKSDFYPPEEYGARWGMPNMGNWSWSGEAQPSTGKWWADWTDRPAPGPGGFQELDLDVAKTNLLKGNYNTEIDNIPANEATTDPIPASLFRTSKPAFFGSLTWPPFNAANPGSAPVWGQAWFQKIPAGQRYVSGAPPTPTPTPSPTATPVPTPSPPQLSFALSWNAVTNAVKYRVFEGTTQIAEQTTTTYSLSGKVGPKAYQVCGVNSANVAGPKSNTVNLPAPTPTPTPTPPPTPTPTATPVPTPAAPVLQINQQ